MPPPPSTNPPNESPYAPDARSDNARELLYNMFDPDTGLPDPAHADEIRRLYPIAWDEAYSEPLLGAVIAAAACGDRLDQKRLDFSRHPPFSTNSVAAHSFVMLGGTFRQARN